MNKPAVTFLSLGNKVLLALVIVLLIFLVKFVLTPSRPVSNSEEYILQHGIREGQSAELIIKGVQLKVPVGYRVEPYTDADTEIVSGVATSANIYFDIVGGRFVPPKSSGASVRIRVADAGSENAKNLEEYLRRQTKGPGNGIDSLGLRSYITDGRGGWENLILEPLDETKTRKGGRVIFNCNGKSLDSPGACRTSYVHPGGLFVEYFYSGASLSEWKVVSSQVVSFVDSIVVGGESQ